MNKQLRRFFNIRYSSLLLSFLCLLCLNNPSLAEEWLELETPHFTIISQLDAEGTQAWAEKINQYIDSLSLVLSVDENRLLPLTIVIFKQGRDYQAYSPLIAYGRDAIHVNGTYIHLNTQNLIAFAESRSQTKNRRIIYHETFHWYAQALDQPTAPWLNEGMAEVFSTVTIEEGLIRFGNIIPGNINFIRFHPFLINTNSLMEDSSLDDFFDSAHNTKDFYVHSWLFVHYQLFGRRGDYESALSDYLSLKKPYLSEDEFRVVFKLSFEEMNERLKKYARSGKFDFIEIETSQPSAGRIPAPASEIQTELALARVAIGASRFETAQGHIDNLMKLQGGTTLANDLQAQVHSHTGASEAAKTSAEKAIALGSSAAETYSLLAEILVSEYSSLNASPTKSLTPTNARAVADLYNQAINYAPRLLSGYKDLAWSLQFLTTVTELDRMQLEQAKTTFPNEGELLMGLALFYYHQDEMVSALEYLYSAETLNGSIRRNMKTNLNSFLKEWSLQYFEEISSNSDSELAKVELTQAALTEYLKKIFSESKLAYIQNMTMAQEAYENGENEKAQAILETVLSESVRISETSRQIKELVDYFER